VRARRSKFGAIRTTVDGITFASKAEARRYQELRLLEKAGEIWNLKLQRSFVLDVPTDGDDEPIGASRADFAYNESERAYVVEDVKGFQTEISKFKLKLMAAVHGVNVELVRNSRGRGWR